MKLQKPAHRIEDSDVDDGPGADVVLSECDGSGWAGSVQDSNGPGLSVVQLVIIDRLSCCQAVSRFISA